MRTAVYIIVLVILFLAIFYWNTRLSRFNTKGPPIAKYSATIDESKQKGLFQFEVVANKSNFTLDSQLSIKVKNAWVENCWSKQVYFIKIGTPDFEKYDASQLIIKLEIDTAKTQSAVDLHYFIGTRPLKPFVYYYCDRLDTIKVPLYKAKSSRPKKDRIAFDTISFARKINKP